MSLLDLLERLPKQPKWPTTSAQCEAEIDRDQPGVGDCLNRTGLGNSLAVMYYAAERARKRRK